jgi:hypothetical protein
MASPFQQQSTARKFIYFGLILALFTVSLIHRKTVINDRANALLLRDVGRGKADLTDSALRLTLSGARGITVTALWLAAIDKQKRHQWNEMEVIVESLTRLQPRFTSPWLFQGWNLAFNVAVECDRPRDKYYYISRGITLLARGEEKNDPGQARPPQPWPANPEMRSQIGFWYQLKIGQSDEQKTMRCLFDLSCIPLSERKPEDFWVQLPSGRKGVDLPKFKLFCENHPRLVRRLRERLKDFEKPEAVIEFLADNKDVPTRIEDRTKLDDDKRLEEFPVLPPQPRTLPEYNTQAAWPYPDWRAENLGDDNEDFDVFICTRCWYTYAQIPLPPEVPDPTTDDTKFQFDRLMHRQPKMTTIIFRGHPARAEEYFANGLQQDAWFDESGWLITDWFDALRPKSESGRPREDGLRVGDGRKRYSSMAAFGRAYEMYRSFGINNGLLIPPERIKEFQQQAATQGPGSLGAMKLKAWEMHRHLTNFDEFYNQTKVERTPEAVAARIAIYEAERDKSSPNIATLYYESVLPQWLDVLLRYPEFRQIGTIQEESFEIEAKYFKNLQYDLKYRPFIDGLVRKVALSVSPLEEAILAPQVLSSRFKVIPIRNVEGPLDQLFVLEGPKEGSKVETLKPVAQALARAVLWPPPPADPKTPDIAFARYVVPVPPGGGLERGKTPEIGLGQHLKTFVAKDFKANPPSLFLMLSSAEERKILTQFASHRQPPAGQGWVPLIPEAAMLATRDRIPWMRARPFEQPLTQQPAPQPRQ